MNPARPRTAPAVGPGGPGLATRLLVAQALVLAAGALTTWLVASAVGPSIFHDHLMKAGVATPAAEARHVEQAFAISTAALDRHRAARRRSLAALAVSWYFSRRVQRSIAQVTAAASQIAAGQYDARVADPGLGGEFGTLAATYNALAERLEHHRSHPATDAGRPGPRDAHPAGDRGCTPGGDRGRRPEHGPDTLRVIRGSTRRLRRLAEDIAAVSRAEEGSLDISPQAVQAAAPARAAAESARDRFDAKGVHLSTHLDTGELVLVDPERIGAGAGQPARQRPAAHPGRWHGHPVLSTAGALGAVRGRRHRRGHQRPSISAGCSTGSTGWTPPGTATGAAPGSG